MSDILSNVGDTEPTICPLDVECEFTVERIDGMGVKPRPIPIPSRTDLPTGCLPANISALPRMMQLTVIRAR